MRKSKEQMVAQPAIELPKIEVAVPKNEIPSRRKVRGALVLWSLAALTLLSSCGVMSAADVKAVNSIEDNTKQLDLIQFLDPGVVQIARNNGIFPTSSEEPVMAHLGDRATISQICGDDSIFTDVAGCAIDTNEDGVLELFVLGNEDGKLIATHEFFHDLLSKHRSEGLINENTHLSYVGRDMYMTQRMEVDGELVLVPNEIGRIDEYFARLLTLSLYVAKLPENERVFDQEKWNREVMWYGDESQNQAWKDVMRLYTFDQGILSDEQRMILVKLAFAGASEDNIFGKESRIADKSIEVIDHNVLWNEMKTLMIKIEPDLAEASDEEIFCFWKAAATIPAYQKPEVGQGFWR